MTKYGKLREYWYVFNVNPARHHVLLTVLLDLDKNKATLSCSSDKNKTNRPWHVDFKVHVHNREKDMCHFLLEVILKAKHDL